MTFNAFLTIFVVINFAAFVLCQNVTVDDVCPDIRDANVALGGPHCCNSTYREFRTRYNVAYLKLTSFLEKLQVWKCPQFESECENRYFDFNRFTSLIYDRFCNDSAFVENCREELEDINAVYGLDREGKTFLFVFISHINISQQGLVVKASASEAVGSGLIPSSVKPMTLKLVYTVSLLDAQQRDNVESMQVGKFTCCGVRKGI